MLWWEIEEISAEVAEKAVHIWSLVVVTTMRQFQGGTPGEKKKILLTACLLHSWLYKVQQVQPKIM